MKMSLKIGLVLALFCGSTLALSNRAAQAGGVGHGGNHGGQSFVHGDFRHDNSFRNNNFGFGGCGGCGCGYGAFYGCDLDSNENHIPFFALHPPVYYSQIIPRAYGWSPFAYSGDAMILPLEDGGPKEIINPYVPPSNTPDAKPSTKAKPTGEQTADDSTATPHLIVNPYVAANLASDEKQFVQLLSAGGIRTGGACRAKRSVPRAVPAV